MQAKAAINERVDITISAAMRKGLGLKPKDEVLFEVSELGMLSRPVLSVPLEIYTEKQISEFAGDDKAIGKLLRNKRSCAHAGLARCERPVLGGQWLCHRGQLLRLAGSRFRRRACR